MIVHLSTTMRSALELYVIIFSQLSVCFFLQHVWQRLGGWLTVAPFVFLSSVAAVPSCVTRERFLPITLIAGWPPIAESP